MFFGALMRQMDFRHQMWCARSSVSTANGSKGNDGFWGELSHRRSGPALRTGCRISPAERSRLGLVWCGGGWARVDGGAEQAHIELGVQLGEPRVLSPQLRGFVLDQLGFALDLLRSLCALLDLALGLLQTPQAQRWHAALKILMSLRHRMDRPGRPFPWRASSAATRARNRRWMGGAAPQGHRRGQGCFLVRI